MLLTDLICFDSEFNKSIICIYFSALLSKIYFNITIDSAYLQSILAV